MRSVRYEEMLPREIVARREAHPVAYLPLGGIEWHGEHLAVGNDALKAHALSCRAAQAGGGLAFPPLWYGEPRLERLMEASHDSGGRIARRMKLPRRNFRPPMFADAPEEQLARYRALVRHALDQIRTLGFRAIVILTGHYPLREFVAPVVRAFNRDWRDCRAWAGIEFHFAPGGRSERVGGDHAAKWETSYLMALRPECVDLSVYRGRPAREKLVGVGGLDPRTEASRDLGERACALIVAGMVRKGNALLAQVARGKRRGRRKGTRR